MQAKEIAKAWHSVTDRWIVRRNKMHDECQWEVVHSWGGDMISEDTQKIVGRYSEQGPAERRAFALEDEARGAAVLAAFIGYTINKETDK